MSEIKYDNPEIIEKVEKAVKSILDEKYSNCYRDHFFPLLIDKMEYKTGAEIGVDKAGFSTHILGKTKIEKYYCIDSWPNDFGSDCKPGYFDKVGDNRFQEAYNTLLPYADKVQILRMNSVEASKHISDNELDFVYVDGDHSLFGIYEDLHAWTPKLKIGGVCAGHDYKDGPRSGIQDYFGNQLDYKIKTVTEEYCKKYGYKLNSVGGRILNWYFVKNH